METTCYMCEALATSKEHVPPRCLFPESKDVSGVDYRKNLITVSSCDLHNSRKSKDDEYLLAVISAYYQNNTVAGMHNATKVLRSLRHSSKLAVQMVADGGSFDDLAYLRVDSKRLFNVCEHIAKGLYFYHYHFKWLQPVKFLSTAFLPVQNTQSFLIQCQQFEKTSSEYLENGKCQFFGDNPEVFRYRLFTDQKSLFVIQFIFYGGVCVSGFSHNI